MRNAHTAANNYCELCKIGRCAGLRKTWKFKYTDLMMRKFDFRLEISVFCEFRSLQALEIQLRWKLI